LHPGTLRAGGHVTGATRGRSLSVVVPAYNEERRLPALLVLLDTDASRLFGPAGLRLEEVIVVDDGSNDGTRRLLETCTELEGRLRVLSLEANRGKGAAVRLGMLAATGDCVLLTDADMSAPLDQVTTLAAELDRGFDLVLGSRGLPESQILVHQNDVRERLGKLYNRLVRALTGLPIHDTQCGFKLFRRASARRLFELQTVDGFAFDVELCVNALRLGLRVSEVPVTWANDPETRVKLFRSSTRMAMDLLRIRRRARAAPGASFAPQSSPRVEPSGD